VKSKDESSDAERPKDKSVHHGVDSRSKDISKKEKKKHKKHKQDRREPLF